MRLGDRGGYTAKVVIPSPPFHCASRVRPTGRIELLTHLAYFGYCFNPASFYYAWDAAGTALEAVLIEVSNTPWNEMHYYVLHPGALGAPACSFIVRGAGGGAAAAAAPAAEVPVCVESSAAAKTLADQGAVAPADFDGLRAAFAAPASAPAAAPAAPLPPGARRLLRASFPKAFHVSPFMGMDQAYTWVLGEPGETLLIQSENRAAAAATAASAAGDGDSSGDSGSPGELLFSTQLRLTRAAATGAPAASPWSAAPRLTLWAAAYLLLVAFPLLTHRIQWLIHVEALRVWWKGGQLFAHPHGATNAFTRAVEGAFTPLALTVAALQWLWRGGGSPGAAAAAEKGRGGGAASAAN